MFRADFHQHSFPWRPHPSSWPSTQTDYSSRSTDVQEELNVVRRNGACPDNLDSKRMLNPTAVPFVPSAYYKQERTSVLQPPNHTDYEQPAQHRQPPNIEVIYPLPSEAATSSQEPFHRISMSARTQIASLRDTVLATRTDVKRERSQRYEQEEEFESIMEQFMGIVNTTTTQGLDLQRRYTLNRLSQKLKRVRNDLRALRERAAALEDILSNHEYQLQRVEKDVYSELDRKLSRTEVSYGAQVQSRSVPTFLPNDPNVDQSAELRDKLYSRMGDLRIHLERLNNFEFDLQEELEERDLLRASGQAELTTDVQFFEQTRADRARIQQDLEEAQRSVRELKEHCIRDGIEFVEPQFPDMLYHAETESFASTFEPSTYWPEAPQGSSSIIGAFFNAQERVKRWLREPSGSPNSGQEGTREVPDERARRESSSSDMGWVMTPSTARRPSSVEAAGKHGSAAHDIPEWRYGPRPGSPLLEALLLESATTPLGRYGLQPEANTKSKARQSLA